MTKCWEIGTYIDYLNLFLKLKSVLIKVEYADIRYKVSAYSPEFEYSCLDFCFLFEEHCLHAYYLYLIIISYTSMHR